MNNLDNLYIFICSDKNVQHGTAHYRATIHVAREIDRPIIRTNYSASLNSREMIRLLVDVINTGRSTKKCLCMVFNCSDEKQWFHDFIASHNSFHKSISELWQTSIRQIVIRDKVYELENRQFLPNPMTYKKSTALDDLKHLYFQFFNFDDDVKGEADLYTYIDQRLTMLQRVFFKMIDMKVIKASA